MMRMVSTSRTLLPSVWRLATSSELGVCGFAFSASEEGSMNNENDNDRERISIAKMVLCHLTSIVLQEHSFDQAFLITRVLVEPLLTWTTETAQWNTSIS